MTLDKYTYILSSNLSKARSVIMDRQQEAEESCDPTEFKFRSRPLTAGGAGIENGIRFFTTAMHALDRIEGALSEIEQTRTLVHQMIGEFSLAGSGVRVPRLTPEGGGQRKKLKPERKELTEKDVCTPR